MRHTILSFWAISAFLAGGTALANGAGNRDKLFADALYRIESNCELVKEYAAIYEWDNVNLEVDRILAAERTVEKAAVKMPDRAKAFDTLREAVSRLRSARLNHDRNRAQEAAEQAGASVRELMR